MHSNSIVVLSIAKTSGYNPGSPNPTTARDMPTRKTKGKQVKQKGYKKSKVASKTPSPAKRKTKTPSPAKRKGATNTPSPSKRNRKAPPEDLQHPTKESMPTLRRAELPTTLDVRRSTRNRTPAPSPPKVPMSDCATDYQGEG